MSSRSWKHPGREVHSSALALDLHGRVPFPKHPSCDRSLILKADGQAESEGAGWSTCDQCDTQGLWWRQSRKDPTKWVSALCTDCEG